MGISVSSTLGPDEQVSGLVSHRALFFLNKLLTEALQLQEGRSRLLWWEGCGEVGRMESGQGGECSTHRPPPWETEASEPSERSLGWMKELRTRLLTVTLITK